MARYRLLFALGSLLYPAWWFVFKASVPGAIDPPAGRVAVGVICFSVLALTFTSRLVAKYVSRVFLACALVMISHTFYLLYLNPGDNHYVAHVFVASFAIGACFISRRQIIIYSVCVMALGIAASFILVNFSKMVFICGLATEIFVSYVAVSSHLHLLETLLESEGRFRVMADKAPVMIWMADENGFCSFLNKVWLGFTGQTLEESNGTGWTKSLHPEDLNRYLDTYFNAFRARKDFQAEFRLKRSDGTYRSVLSRGIPLYETSGRFTGYIGTCVDVTGRPNP